MSSAAGSELVETVLAGEAATTHQDSESLLFIDAKLRSGKSMQYHHALPPCLQRDFGSWMVEKAAEGPTTGLSEWQSDDT